MTEPIIEASTDAGTGATAELIRVADVQALVNVNASAGRAQELADSWNPPLVALDAMGSRGIWQFTSRPEAACHNLIGPAVDTCFRADPEGPLWAVAVAGIYDAPDEAAYQSPVIPAQDTLLGAAQSTGATALQQGMAGFQEHQRSSQACMTSSRSLSSLPGRTFCPTSCGFGMLVLCACTYTPRCPSCCFPTMHQRTGSTSRATSGWHRSARSSAFNRTSSSSVGALRRMSCTKRHVRPVSRARKAALNPSVSAGRWPRGRRAGRRRGRCRWGEPPTATRGRRPGRAGRPRSAAWGRNGRAVVR